MHTFQEVNLNYLKESPFKLIGKDWMLISAEKDNKVNTMTASWGGLGVMWGKNVAFIVVRDSRYTKEFIDNSDTFSLSFFNPEKPDIKKALSYLGSVSGRDENKIKNANMKVNLYVDKNKCETPFIDEAQIVLICRKMAAQKLSKDSFILPEIDKQWYSDGDYHTLYIGEIEYMLGR